MTTANHDHERTRELLCLALYGELAPEERAELEPELSACGACRAFAAELDAALGALQGPRARDRELPADWTPRLVTRVRAEGRRRALRRALTFASGLAAGALLTALVLATPSPAPRAPEPTARAPLAPPFELRATAPPPAAGRGALAHFGGWARVGRAGR
jgi:anti-sigma factor RsiW